MLVLAELPSGKAKPLCPPTTAANNARGWRIMVGVMLVVVIARTTDREWRLPSSFFPRGLIKATLVLYESAGRVCFFLY